jgi:SpoVK/Ycf46/Vps4 family AAA+-type ATPase
MADIEVQIVSSQPEPPQQEPQKRKLEVPEWAKAIKRKFLSENVSQFILHGNINDYTKFTENGEAKYLKTKDFLDTEILRYHDVIVYFDRASGIYFKDDFKFGGKGEMNLDFMNILKLHDQIAGKRIAQALDLKDPFQAFQALDLYFNLCVNSNYIDYYTYLLQTRYKLIDAKKQAPVPPKNAPNPSAVVQQHLGELFDFFSDGVKRENTVNQEDIGKVKEFIDLLEKRKASPKRIGFIINFAETVIPMADVAQYRDQERSILVFLQKWATNERFQEADMFVTLLTENISEINQQYVRNPYTYEMLVPYPDEMDRLGYVQNFFAQNAENKKFFEMPAEVLAKNTAGLKLIQLRILLSESVQNEILFTNHELVMKKKEMIESESGGLLEFIQTKYSLANVAGHKYAKKNLMEAATALKAGRSDVMPMGYLVSGPVGTGKTYLISCFANDIGVPMVMLKNFRSQWQGQTEGNLEKVLKILKAMSPVAVMIDEADAYLGNRSASGDSGVSSRVFSMIATFMSNTENRGKVIWFLITARPDLLPVDFKRQGRAEEHIALFYPETLEEKKELLQVCLKKTGLDYLSLDEFDEEFFEDMSVKSGADMESALTRAKFKAATLGIEKVTFDIIAQVFGDFLPPTYPDEIELMNYAAVLECTSKELLPPTFRDIPRKDVLERVEELKMRIR